MRLEIFNPYEELYLEAKALFSIPCTSHAEMKQKITELMSRHNMVYPRETVLIGYKDSFDWQIPDSIYKAVHDAGCMILYYDNAYRLRITQDRNYGRVGLSWEVKVATCPAMLDLPTEKHVLKSGETCVLNTTVVEDLKSLHGISRRKSINMVEKANACID